MIWKRLHKDDSDFLMLIVGPRGSGKSTAAVRLCELVDKDFTIDNVVFTPEQFSDLVNSGRLKEGAAILFDEIGVGANSREWYSMGNKLLNFFTQVSRTMHLFCVFTTLDEAKVDAQIKKNFTAICETDGIDKVKQVGWLKISMVQVNPMDGTLFHKYFRFFNEKKELIRYSRVGVHLPSRQLDRAYKRMRNDMGIGVRTDMQTSIKTGVYTKHGKDFKKRIEKKEKPKEDLQGIAKKIASFGSMYRSKRGWNTLKIMEDFNISERKSILVGQYASSLQQ